MKRTPLGYRVIFLGSEVEVSVMTPRQKELLTNMPEKKVRILHLVLLLSLTLYLGKSGSE